MDLVKLNSATKYPSIPTYHALGERGRLTDEHIALSGRVFASEKIDGTNTRIIILPDNDYIIGSREELLTAKGDRISNPSMGIVAAVKDIAERLANKITIYHGAIAIYGETYGKPIGANGKQYGASAATGFRVFDVADFSTIDEVLSLDVAAIARWRDNGNQLFLPIKDMLTFAFDHDLYVAPCLFDLDAAAFPTTHEDVLTLLIGWVGRTHVALDDGGGNRAEGLVIRTADRKTIAKLRFEDYERTLRRR